MSNRTVHVVAVSIPAMSTIGRCVGLDIDTLEVVRFAADHRPARHLGEAVLAAKQADEDPPVAELEDWQVLSIHEPDSDITPERITT